MQKNVQWIVVRCFVYVFGCRFMRVFASQLPQPNTTSVVVINSNSEHEEEEEPPLRNFRWNAYTRSIDREVGADVEESSLAAAPAILALAPLLPVLTNAAAPAILALAPLPPVLTEAAAPAFLALAPLLPVLTNAAAPAFLALAPLLPVLTNAAAPAFLAPIVLGQPKATADEGTREQFFASKFFCIRLYRLENAFDHANGAVEYRSADDVRSSVDSDDVLFQ